MLLTTFLLLSCYAITIQGETHCNTCADIVLLIDESGSIDDTEFGLMIDFLKSLVNAFAANIGTTNGVQIGAACFSSINNQRDHFYLNQFDSAPAINSVLDSITPHGGGTYLGLALQYVRENMFGVSVGGGRPCAQRFVLVFTDGVSQDLPETEANLLKAQNVKIISVGIGNGIDQHQLQNIASSLDLVFIADFDGLQSIKQTIMNAVCQQENSGDMKGFCGFPCTLQNKTFDLCPCDPDNTNQTLSIQSLDPTVIAFIEGTETEEWQCFQRSGRFYVLRYYSEPPRRRSINIINGVNYSKSRDMFEAVCTNLKRSGLGNVTHKPVINAEDLVKIRNYFETWRINPFILVRKVWFDLMMFCCRRGREGLRELNKDSYVVETDGAGTRFIRKNGSEVTKNHRNDLEDSTGGIIYEEKESELCPVKSFSLYVQKLNPNSNALFQRPKDKFQMEDDVWFENKPLGKNSLGDMMMKISKAAGLSKDYTNHSIRSTSITTLSESGFEDRKIKTISKHKSLHSIESYASDTSLPEKKKMSESLAETVYNIQRDNQPTCVSKALAYPVSKDVSSNMHTTVTSNMADLDFLDDSIILDPQLDRILAEVSSSQYNVNNNINRESTCNRSINIQNVSGGVFNFYLTK